MNRQLVMLSGLPRSGSQVLSSMLNQHPKIHSTTTSPVADLFVLVGEQWPVISQAVKDPHPAQYKNILNGVIEGAYRHIDKPIIVDKNRLWPRYGKIMQQVLGERPRIICTVRDIPSILASYILLIEKNKTTVSFVDQELIDTSQPINNRNRCRILWEKYITHPYNSVRIGLNSGNADLLFVTYDMIVQDSQTTVNKICKFIGIENFVLDRNNLQSMDENDEYHGGLRGLHEVRSSLMKASPPSDQVIGRDLVKLYTDMQLDFWKKHLG